MCLTNLYYKFSENSKLKIGYKVLGRCGDAYYSPLFQTRGMKMGETYNAGHRGGESDLIYATRRRLPPCFSPLRGAKPINATDGLGDGGTSYRRGYHFFRDLRCAEDYLAFLAGNEDPPVDDKFAIVKVVGTDITAIGTDYSGSPDDNSEVVVATTITLVEEIF